MTTDLIKLVNPTVGKAIDALQHANAREWLSLFVRNAIVYDHGNQMTAGEFIEKSAGNEHFASIDKTENNGLAVFGHFHSKQLGDFQVCFRFHLNGKAKVSRLEIAQAVY